MSTRPRRRRVRSTRKRVRVSVSEFSLSPRRSVSCYHAHAVARDPAGRRLGAGERDSGGHRASLRRADGRRTDGSPTVAPGGTVSRAVDRFAGSRLRGERTSILDG